MPDLKIPRLLLASAMLAVASAANAGPPFVTDDPEPTDPGHWEIYNFIAGGNVQGETSGEFGLDLNYGGAKDLQLTAVLPAEFTKDGTLTVGVGDIELAAKYKFLHQSEAIGLDVSFFPRLFVPTATSRHGDRAAALLLPLWAQKDFGDWSLFGGGGYMIDGSRDAHDYWVSGVGVTRRLGDKFLLGAEVYRHGSEAPDARRFTAVNVGGAYKLSDHWSLLGSFGPGIENAGSEGKYAFYAALKADF